MAGIRRSYDIDSGDEASAALRDGRPVRREHGVSRRFKTMFACFVLLSAFVIGFVFLNLVREQQQTPAFQHDEAEDEDGAGTDVDVIAIEPGTIFPARNQFDLKTGFVVSDQPETREYTFNITRGMGAPDGWNKSMILVNGQSPGPLIEVNTGDTLRVTVHNMMPEEGTTIHWHGIDQKDSVWMDGVYGVTQCAIPPGESFTYEFVVADQRGTYWYHSHVAVQFTDGLFGPLIVHDPIEMVPPVDDEKIMFIGDLYHHQAGQLLEQYLSPSSVWSASSGAEPPVNNILINGRHTTNCSNPFTEYPITLTPPRHEDDEDEDEHEEEENHDEGTDCSGGSIFSTQVKSNDKVRLRLISHSSNLPHWFTVDNHTLEIVEMDGTEIEPIATSRVFINPGQRYSVILNANQTAGNYLIRAAASQGCGMMSSDHISGLASIDDQATAILSYDETDPDEEPIGQPWDLDSKNNTIFGNEPWHKKCQELPFDMAKPKRGRDAYEAGEKNKHVFTFNMVREKKILVTSIDKNVYSPLQDDATLWKAMEQDLSTENMDADTPTWDFGENQRVLVSRDSDAAAEIIVNAGNMMTHPWHMHGQSFQVVGWGRGTFGKGDTTWNLENPMRRDTLTIPGSSHVVLRLAADNPGVWAFHCHILWHSEGGMFITYAQQLDKLKDMLQSLGSDDEDASISRQFCSIPSTPE